MKVLIINQFFYPDIAATAQLMTDLTEDLADKKVEVTVLTSNSNYLGGKLDLKRNGRLFAAKIVRVNCWSFGRSTFLRRILDYASFFVLIIFRSLLLPRHDVVLALTTPPLISVVGLILKVFKRSKYVCLMEDLYPDTALALGILKEKHLVVKAAHYVANLVYRYADRIIAISQNMQTALIEKGVSRDKITVIDNWADKKQIYPVVKKHNWFIEKHALSGKFVVEYSGNIGLGHDFTIFLEGIKRLRSLSEIHFLFIGDGLKKTGISEFKNRHSLFNLSLMPYQKRADLAYSISAGDVSLISLKNALDGCIVPSKIYGIMAAARPVIFVGSPQSDIAEIIRRAHCGFQIDDGDVDAFVDKILLLYHNQELGFELGNNGYQYFLKNFERRQSTLRYFNLLTEVWRFKKNTHFGRPEDGVSSARNRSLPEDTATHYSGFLD
ncbi:MAG: glycosyltransferase family 4 protein [bacterium]